VCGVCVDNRNRTYSSSFPFFSFFSSSSLSSTMRKKIWLDLSAAVRRSVILILVGKRINCTSVCACMRMSRHWPKRKEETSRERKLIDIYRPMKDFFAKFLFRLADKTNEKKRKKENYHNMCSSIHALEKDQIETMCVVHVRKKKQ